MGEPLDRVVEADQLLCRRQAAQRVAHLGQPVLDAGERVVIDAVLAAFRDALGEAEDLLFDGLDLAPRHGLVERVADLDELAAQRIDRFLDARLAQRLDLVGDAAELILQPGKVLRRQRAAPRAAWRPPACAGRGAHGRGLRHRRRVAR